MNREDLLSLKEKFYADLAGKFDINIFPIVSYIKALDAYPRIASWKYQSKKVRKVTHAIREKYGAETLGLYHKLLLVELLLRNENTNRVNPQINEVDRYYDNFFDQLVERLKKTVNDESFDYSYKRFRFELGICRGFIIPMAPQYVNPDIISILAFFKGGLKQFFKGLVYLLFNLRGIFPVFKLHLNSNDVYALSKFNEAGWTKQFKELAEVLLANPKVKGISGTTWFLDPHLKAISSEIAYVQDLFEACNALVMYNGIDDDTVKEALFLSKDRKQKYQEGSYHPARYTCIISRHDLIRWYRNVRAK